jgi:prepilin-type N-terminal cleavage/methylation domain-containing protein
MRKCNKGFSLIELSVVLVVLGGVLVGLQNVIPSVKQVFFSEDEQTIIKKADMALKGFIKANSRLPCPASDLTGIESCVAGNQSGFFPYRTLGLSSPVKNPYGQPLAYAVYRQASTTTDSYGNSLDMDFTVAKDRFRPYLPPGELSANSNGLDFCWALKNAGSLSASAAHPYIGTTPLNPLYIIASPGAVDMDNNNDFFDGVNGLSNLKFEVPSRIQNSRYDDQVFSVGINQMAGDLGCPRLMAKVNGAARAAYAAFDIDRVNELYIDFRDLTYKVAVTTDEQADASVAVTTVLLALKASQVLGVAAIALSSFPGPALAGAATAALAISTAAAISATVVAVNNAEKTETAKNFALQESLLAQGTRAGVSQLVIDKVAQAKALDNKGWF